MPYRSSPVRIALWTCLCCFTWYAPPEGKSKNFRSSQLKAVEKRLQDYLNKRVLVFRKGVIDRHQITFDSQGRLLAESDTELKSSPNAILFVGLALDAERLAISGEAVRFRPRVSRPILSRNPREFRLVTCTIILDAPPDELSFAHAIGLLCKVFLTKEELKDLYLLQDETRRGWCLREIRDQTRTTRVPSKSRK